MVTSSAAAAVPMTVVATDGRIDLAQLDRASGWPVSQQASYGRRYALPDGRFLHGFNCGAVVLEGPGGVDAALRETIERVTDRKLLGPTMETYTVEELPGAAAAQAGWDRVVVPEHTPERMHAIALLLAQSAALERYEHAAERMLDEALAAARRLAEMGRPPVSANELVRRVGKLTGDRLEVARWFFLVDRPEVTWEKADVASLYDALFHNLELEERHRAVLHKLDAVASCIETTVGLWHARRSHFLEWAIVLLIVLEIVFAALGVYG